MLRTLVVLPLVLLSLFTLVQSEWTHSWDKPFTPSSRARLIYWINHCLTDANFDRDTQSCPTTELLYSDSTFCFVFPPKPLRVVLVLVFVLPTI